MFSAPNLRYAKTPIARCENRDRFATIEAIDRPGVKVIVNPGGINERFDRANLNQAGLRVHADNTTIFDPIVDGTEDLMITDASEARYQQKLRPELLRDPSQPAVRLVGEGLPGAAGPGPRGVRRPMASYCHDKWRHIATRPAPARLRDLMAEVVPTGRPASRLSGSIARRPC